MVQSTSGFQGNFSKLEYNFPLFRSKRHFAQVEQNLWHHRSIYTYLEPLVSLLQKWVTVLWYHRSKHTLLIMKINLAGCMWLWKWTISVLFWSLLCGPKSCCKRYVRVMKSCINTILEDTVAMNTEIWWQDWKKVRKLFTNTVPSDTFQRPKLRSLDASFLSQE